MTNENEKIKQLEEENKRMKKQLDNHFTILQELGVLKDKWNEEIKSNAERISEQDDLINQLNDDLDYALSMANKVEELIAFWNAHHPGDKITIGQRTRRPESDYAMTDDEWKERTLVLHPREWKNKFDPTTGEFQ
jgi:chromosome segregation ATPase